MQTAGFNNTAPGQMRSQIGNDMQTSKKQCSFKRRRVCYEPGKKFGLELAWKCFRSRKIQGEYCYQAEPVDCLISVCKLCCTEFLLIH